VQTKRRFRADREYSWERWVGRCGHAQAGKCVPLWHEINAGNANAPAALMINHHRTNNMTRLDDGAMRLREGLTVWQAGAREKESAAAPRTPRVIETDIVVVGAGITGAFAAERLTRSGARVTLIDRHAPATGSTAASTAMLLWELDSPLLEIEQRLGVDAAGLIALHCRRQVQEIGALVGELGIDCDFAFRPSLYLAGDKLDATDLREEHHLRGLLGIEGAYLDSGALAARGFVGDGALLYPGSAEVDPVKLARGLLSVALKRGAELICPATAMVYEALPDRVRIETLEGDVVRAQTLVIANGYEMPEFVPAERHSIAATWAIATTCKQPCAWPDRALVWEASEPYLYMRLTADGRVIIGGADEENMGQGKASKLIAQKTQLLLKAGAARSPALAGADVEYAWTGAFGETDDSLPLIGPVPGRARCLAAYGYGGNGITFSALAAEMLEAALEHRNHPMAAKCALDRR
jgi:glycine/D-amino acid oxidase-like deaminating enzyme